jgi:hypothetical protein
MPDAPGIRRLLVEAGYRVGALIDDEAEFFAEACADPAIPFPVSH